MRLLKTKPEKFFFNLKLENSNSMIFVAVQDLKVGDKIQTLGEEFTTIKEITRYTVPETKEEAVRVGYLVDGKMICSGYALWAELSVFNC